jgi:hypothetical protein
MYIEYWIDNKDSENELHYMKISNTGIIITGITKKDTFRLLKERLNQFITDFKQLKTVEIGNIQEGNSPYEEKINMIPEIIKRDRGFDDYLAHKIRQEKRKGKFTNDK